MFYRTGLCLPETWPPGAADPGGSGLGRVTDAEDDDQFSTETMTTMACPLGTTDRRTSRCLGTARGSCHPPCYGHIHVTHSQVLGGGGAVRGQLGLFRVRET